MKNEFKATQKYLIMSPRKLRLVVGLIKKMSPVDAIEKLPFASRRAAFDLGKVIKSALANATSQGVSEKDLVFKEIQIGEGPRLKRGKAASRGRWHPFKKRMSHIRVILTTVKKKEVKEVKTEEVKVEEAKTEQIKAKVVTEKKEKKGAIK
jgi:large subunit ribosomal protein L22